MSARGVLYFSFIVLTSIHESLAQEPSCVGQQDGKTLPSFSSPHQFYICISSQPYLQMCPNSLSFCFPQGYCAKGCDGVTSTPPTTTERPPTCNTPSTTSIITSTTESPTTPVANLCEKQQNGVLFPLAGSCSGFIMCSKGESFVGKCLNNLAFNPKTGTCSNKTCA